MHRLRLVLLFSLSLHLTGCMLSTAEPLAPSAQGIRDESVLGEWQEVMNPSVHLRVEQLDPHTVRISYITPDAPITWDGHITTIGAWNVANLRNPPVQAPRRDESVAWPAYMLVPYVVTKGKLHAWILPSPEWEKMISEGTVRGYVPHGQGGFLFLDDTPERMRAAFMKLQQRPYWDAAHDFQHVPPSGAGSK